VSGFLLDTNVISMLSPTKDAASEEFIRWLETEDAEERIFLSAVTVHEIEKGIGLLQRKGAGAKAASLRLWLSGLVSTYEDKVLPIDTAVSSLSGRLEAVAIAAGYHPGMADALIAGTAKAHELTVVTRNLKHFEPFSVALVSPETCKPAGGPG
jgi:predicted nucleic acid-binding protein